MNAGTRLIASILAATAWLQASDPLLRAGDRVAVIGDSITEQRLYSRFIEVYLLASSGIANLDVAHFGLGGERASGWVSRGQKAIEWFKPTVVTTCYGMNDGSYRPYTDEIGKAYSESTARYIDQMKQAGVRELVIGSPGAVDTVTWRNPVGAAVYNQCLEKLAGLAKAVATEKGVRFADVHHPMVKAMAKAKAAYGDAYHVCGHDGVHPDLNGHLLIAAAFLSALGCDGEIGRFTFTPDGRLTVSPGHTVVTGGMEIDSARWPYSIGGDSKLTGAIRSIVPHTDFIEKLNRFVVVMPDCPWLKAKITWADKAVVVDGTQLKAGVNLMALFTATPFDAPMEALHKAVAARQTAEAVLLKSMIGMAGRDLIDSDPSSNALFVQLIDRQVVVRNEKAVLVRAMVKPVRHRIVICAAQ
jgi:lysophospholipase L1-like esterase